MTTIDWDLVREMVRSAIPRLREKLEECLSRDRKIAVRFQVREGRAFAVIEVCFPHVEGRHGNRSVVFFGSMSLREPTERELVFVAEAVQEAVNAVGDLKVLRVCSERVGRPSQTFVCYKVGPPDPLPRK